MRKLLGLLFGLALCGQAWAVDTSTLMGDANYSATNTDVRIITSTAFTAARTLTLPYAGGTNIGQGGGPSSGGGLGSTALEILDNATAITNTNTLTIAPQSGDTINGSSSSLVYTSPNIRVILWPLSGTNWFAQVTTSAGQVPAVATNNNACTGCVGEYSSTANSAGTNIVTQTPVQIAATSSLGAGDWECRGSITRTLGASGSITQLKTSIGTVTATDGSTTNGTMDIFSTAANVVGTNPITMLVGPARLNIASASAFFLNANDTFTVASNTGTGFIACRRIR